MLESTLHIIDQLGVQIAENFKDNLPKASGNTASEIKVESRAERNRYVVEVTGPSYVMNLVLGRGPTKKPGNGQVKRQIRDWIDAKGIIPKGKMTKDSLAYVIAQEIHKKGFKAKVPDLFEKSINQNEITKTEQMILDEAARAAIMIFQNFQKDVSN